MTDDLRTCPNCTTRYYAPSVSSFMRCPGCRKAARLTTRLAELENQLAEARERVRALEEAARDRHLEDRG